VGRGGRLKNKPGTILGPEQAANIKRTMGGSITRSASKKCELENMMNRRAISTCLVLGLAASGLAHADDKAMMIASAESAGTASVTANATIKAPDGMVLRKGSSSYTCYPQQEIIGPMCNEPVWDELIGAMLTKQSFSADRFSVSYMLAGEGTALGVSNSDPYATEPDKSRDWVKEGPHLMIVVPEGTTLAGLSTNPTDPVYVMWKDTQYAHIMVKVAADE
jgi:hypothetical protein